MSQTISPAPVRKTVTVNAPPAKAFDVFTRSLDAWWPRTHHIGKSTMKLAHAPYVSIINCSRRSKWRERSSHRTSAEAGTNTPKRTAQARSRTCGTTSASWTAKVRNVSEANATLKDKKRRSDSRLSSRNARSSSGSTN